MDDKETFQFFWTKDSFFSQFHPAQFVVDGVQYSCAEQFMMHQKALLFNDEEIANKILKENVPPKIKALGRKVRGFDCEIWDQNKRDIVKKGNFAKFSQNPHLKENLLSTGSATLVEASPNDKIWGIGLAATDERALSRKTWRGQNLLGEIITEVKEEIKALEN